MDKFLCMITAIFAVAGMFDYRFFAGAIVTTFINACILVIESVKSES